MNTHNVNTVEPDLSTAKQSLLSKKILESVYQNQSFLP